jgi:predicted membrane protein
MSDFGAEVRTESRRRATGRLIFGLVVIWLGVLFLLQELTNFDADVILRWWPVALIAYGLMRLTGTWSRQQVTAGAIFTLLGLWMLLRSLGIMPVGIGDLWPVVLIAIGALMVSGGMRRSRAPTSSGDSTNTVSAFAFWSGVDRRVVTTDFQGGDLTAFMGGHDIDLRAAKMNGQSATIDLLVVMGGVDLRVPDDWAVSVEAMPIMGAVEDRSRPPAGEVKGRLILKGFVMMGGVEVKN